MSSGVGGQSCLLGAGVVFTGDGVATGECVGREVGSTGEGVGRDVGSTGVGVKLPGSRCCSRFRCLWRLSRLRCRFNWRGRRGRLGPPALGLTDGNGVSAPWGACVG